MIAIINGNIVQEHGILKDHALLIEQERIYDIVPQAKLASMRIDEVYNAYGDTSHRLHRYAFGSYRGHGGTAPQQHHGYGAGCI